jgi:hypothetical protein
MERPGKNSATGRAIYVGAIVAMVGILAGMAVAATFNFSVTNLGQDQSYYSVASGQAPGYGTSGSAASVNANFVPTSVTSCTTPFSTVAGDTDAATTVVVLSYTSVSPTTSCAAVDWAEEFNISFSENFPASTGGYQTNNVTIVTTVGGAAAPTTNSVTLTMGDGTTGSTFTQDLQVYVDYGTGSVPPSTGISALELEIH